MKKRTYYKPGISVLSLRSSVALAAGSPLTGQTGAGTTIGNGGKDTEGMEGQAKLHRYSAWETDWGTE